MDMYGVGVPPHAFRFYGITGQGCEQEGERGGGRRQGVGDGGEGLSQGGERADGEVRGGGCLEVRGGGCLSMGRVKDYQEVSEVMVAVFLISDYTGTKSKHT